MGKMGKTNITFLINLLNIGHKGVTHNATFNNSLQYYVQVATIIMIISSLRSCNL